MDEILNVEHAFTSSPMNEEDMPSKNIGSYCIPIFPINHDENVENKEHEYYKQPPPYETHEET